MEFLGSNIISINQFEKDDIELIFKTADSLIPFANRSKLTKVLDGAISVSYTHLRAHETV